MLIKLKDYERIYQITSAVIESEDGDTTHSCIYYSLFGAAILLNHFGLDAKVRCGLALYHLGEDDQVLCFGEMLSSGVKSSEDGFHCWVEVDGWIIDFMAPRFGSIKRTEFTKNSKMFQKKASNMKKHPDDMKQSGDFFLLHNPELSARVLVPVVERIGVQDLANVCSEWFKKVPKKILNYAATADQNGKIRRITLKPISLRSNW